MHCRGASKHKGGSTRRAAAQTAVHVQEVSFKKGHTSLQSEEMSAKIGFGEEAIKK